MPEQYLESAIRQFEYYKSLAEKTFAQVGDEDLFWQYNEESNSIAIIVKHMRGNMLSRWTDFLTSDGEKEWRNRDSEFWNDIKDRKELMDKWNEGWACFFNAVKALTDNDMSKIVHIRNEAHSITDAINRQLAHYAYHVGQIVFIGKMIAATKWKSLSIPKGASRAFNDEKFSGPR